MHVLFISTVILRGKSLCSPSTENYGLWIEVRLPVLSTRIRPHHLVAELFVEEE